MNLERWLYAFNMGLTQLWKSRNTQFINRSNWPNGKFNIVVVKLDEIGDMAATIHVFALLKQAFPLANITVLCKPFTATLLTDMDGFSGTVVHQTTDLPKTVDIWLELRGNWKTALLSVIRWPKFRADRGTIRFAQRGNQAHEIWTNYRVIQPLLPNQWQYSSWEEWLNKGMEFMNYRPNSTIVESVNQRVQSWGKFAIIHPAARRILRQWNPERFAEIANYISEAYQLTPVLVGTPDEAPILNRISELSPRCIQWINTEGISTLCAVLTKAQLFVGNESGPLQLAGICTVPRVGIFGPGVPHVFYPVGAKAQLVHEILDCNPCDQVNCKFADNPCIQRIGVERVKKAIDLVLAN